MDISTSNKIFESLDYDKFSFLKGNREIVSNTKLERLMESIKHNNKLSLNPIIVTKGLKIIDGQHRYYVCKKLGLPIYYVIDEFYSGLKEVIDLNTNQNSWSTSDYINSYIESGNSNYLKLRSFMDKYNIGASTSMYIIKRRQHNIKNKGNTYVYVIKNGSLEIADSELGVAMDFMDKIKPFLDVLGNVDSKFIHAYIVLETYNKFDYKTLLRKVMENRYEFTRKVSINAYKTMLSEFYNYRKRNNKISFRDKLGEMELESE